MVDSQLSLIQDSQRFLNPRLGSHLQLWRGEVGQHNRGRIQLNSFVTPHKEQSEKRKEVEKKDEAWTA